MPRFPLRPSWYFLAPASELPRHGPGLEVVAADRLITLRRDAWGRAQAQTSGAPIELRERGPMVLAWLGGGTPSFEVEDFSCEGWLPMRWFHLDLETRPENVMRDLADLEHFESVHNYAQLELDQPFTCAGPTCSMALRFGWDTGLGEVTLPARFWAQVEGLGVQRTLVESVAGRLYSRHLVLPTPRLGGVTRIHAGYSVKPPRAGSGWLEAQALIAYLGRSFRRDLARDAELWTARSTHRPQLTPALARYREWLHQFDHDPSLAQAS